MPAPSTELTPPPSAPRTAMQGVRAHFPVVVGLRKQGRSWTEIAEILANRFEIVTREGQPLSITALRSAFFMVGIEGGHGQEGHSSFDVSAFAAPEPAAPPAYAIPAPIPVAAPELAVAEPLPAMAVAEPLPAMAEETPPVAPPPAALSVREPLAETRSTLAESVEESGLAPPVVTEPDKERAAPHPDIPRSAHSHGWQDDNLIAPAPPRPVAPQPVSHPEPVPPVVRTEAEAMGTEAVATTVGTPPVHETVPEPTLPEATHPVAARSVPDVVLTEENPSRTNPPEAVIVPSENRPVRSNGAEAPYEPGSAPVATGSGAGLDWFSKPVDNTPRLRPAAIPVPLPPLRPRPAAPNLDLPDLTRPAERPLAGNSPSNVPPRRSTPPSSPPSVPAPATPQRRAPEDAYKMNWTSRGGG